MPHLSLKKFAAYLGSFWLMSQPVANFASGASACDHFYRKLQLPPLVLQKTEYTCGAACIVSLLKQLSGKSLKESHVAAVIGTNRAVGTAPEKMVKGLRTLGLKGKMREQLGLSSLKSNFARKRGQILLVQSGDTAHWVVLADYKGGKITLMDPWKENESYLVYSEEEFLALWNTSLMGKKKNQLAIVVD